MLNAAEANAAVSVAGASAGGSTGNQAADADLFAKELGSRLAESTTKARDKIAATMEKLAGAFPGSTITNASISSFSQTSQYFMRAGDNPTVNISSDVMTQMADNEELFTKIKSLLDSLFEAGNSQNLVDVGNSNVSRSVNVSGTEVRYVEVQRSSSGTQLSVTSLAMETQQFIGDTLDQLLASRQNGGSFTGSTTQSWGFNNLISSSSSWRFEGIISSASSLNQMLWSQQNTVSSMEIIIQQWETEGSSTDLFTYMQIMGLSDPLVFDLGDEGINLGSVEDGVYFDIKGDGSPVQTAWISGNNAFLYLDANGNGVADDANELFGDHGGFANGFEKLAQYDDNGDGVIDENDAIYSQLRLWRDLNGDGVNQADESLTLAQAGIKSINLRHDNNQNLDAHGNVIGERSTFTRNDGSQGLVADVWLKNR